MYFCVMNLLLTTFEQTLQRITLVFHYPPMQGKIGNIFYVLNQINGVYLVKVQQEDQSPDLTYLLFIYCFCWRSSFSSNNDPTFHKVNNFDNHRTICWPTESFALCQGDRCTILFFLKNYACLTHVKQA